MSKIFFNYKYGYLLIFTDISIEKKISPLRSTEIQNFYKYKEPRSKTWIGETDPYVAGLVFPYHIVKNDLGLGRWG